MVLGFFCFAINEKGKAALERVFKIKNAINCFAPLEQVFHLVVLFYKVFAPTEQMRAKNYLLDKAKVRWQVKLPGKAKA
jgi:hypothetical protein